MKQFLTTDVGSYAFSASAKTVTFTGFTPTLNQIVAIINTTRNVVIYNPTKATLGGTISGAVLTLTFDTTAHANTDKLMIFVDAPTLLALDATLTGGTAKARTSDSLGQSQYNFPAGFVRMTDEPHQLFYDPFDAGLDTTDRWNAATASGGGVAASVAAGVLTLGSGTTANGYSYLQSKNNFTPTVPGWLGVSYAIAIESAVGNNAVRFWGVGTSPGTPSSTTPLTDAYGFELDIAGVLQAVVYSAGTRTVVASLAATQPADAAYHRYIVYYRTDRIFWYIDSLATPVATSTFQSPAVQTLPVKLQAVAHSTAPASSRVITCTGLAVWDTAKNNYTISDGQFGWRKATIKAPSTLALATDTQLVVGLHPSSNAVDVADRAARLLGVVDKGKLWDGTNIAAVKATNTPAVSTDPALVVAISPGTGLPGGNNFLGTVKVSDGTNSIVVKAAGTAAGAGDTSLVVGLSPNSPMPAPTLTKGTQSATGFSVQNLMDSGRVNLSFFAEVVIAATTEAMLSLQKSADGAASSAATSQVITSGKRFRLTSVQLAVENTLGVSLQRAYFRIRFAATGGALTTSPQMTSWAVQAAGTVKSIDKFFIDFPDGVEWLGDGTKAWGLSCACVDWVAATSTATVRVTLTGFEY